MSDRANTDTMEQLPLTWDTYTARELVSIPLTASEYESLRQIGADPNVDTAAAIAS
jgi:hypothetical protein